MKEARKEIEFRKSERIAIAFLLLLILGSYIYSLMMKPDFPVLESQTNIENLITEQELDTVKRFIKRVSKPRKKKSYSAYKTEVKYENFDPNATDSLKWIQLGLKPWTISNIIKYQSKGGQFYNCTDLQKIYSLEDKTYQALLPYCSIKKKKTSPKRRARKTYKPDSTKSYQKKAFQKKKYEAKSRPIVDINLADTLALQSLYGIGPVLSKRIVKFRNNIGGFHSLSQVTEVYGVEEEVLIKNEARLSITPQIRKLNLNSSLDSLALHPYLGWKKAKVIYNYRKHHGDYTKPEQLKDVKVISDSIYNKLLPYL